MEDKITGAPAPQWHADNSVRVILTKNGCEWQLVLTMWQSKSFAEAAKCQYSLDRVGPTQRSHIVARRIHVAVEDWQAPCLPPCLKRRSCRLL